MKINWICWNQVCKCWKSSELSTVLHPSLMAFFYTFYTHIFYTFSTRIWLQRSRYLQFLVTFIVYIFHLSYTFYTCIHISYFQALTPPLYSVCFQWRRHFCLIPCLTFATSDFLKVERVTLWGQRSEKLYVWSESFELVLLAS